MSAQLDIVPLQDWMNTGGKPFMIAGPCSAETEEQVWETATRIAKEGYAHAIRAGVWKPRTRPGSFEGMGEVALPWLQAVKKETGLPIAVEVATPQHVELALKYGVDILWIGARTTVNPFNVQDLADALKGVDEFVLAPGANQIWQKKLDAETRVIGIMAAYQAIDTAQWRAWKEVPPNETTLLAAEFGPAGVVIREAAT